VSTVAAENHSFAHVVITRDIDEGWVNLGCYRVMVHPSGEVQEHHRLANRLIDSSLKPNSSASSPNCIHRSLVRVIVACRDAANNMPALKAVILDLATGMSVEEKLHLQGELSGV